MITFKIISTYKLIFIFPSLAVSHILSIQCPPSGQLGQFVHYFSISVIIFIVDNIANILNTCVSFSIFSPQFSTESKFVIEDLKASQEEEKPESDVFWNKTTDPWNK